MKNTDIQRLSVRLRRIQLPDDIENAMPWYSDADVLYFSEGPNASPFSKARIEGMYRWLSEKGQVYIVEVLDDKGWVPVGDASLLPDLIPIVIGDQQYRNRGVGSRVLQLLIKQAKDLGWSKIVAHKIFAYNVRSIKLFEKHGFVKIFSSVDEEGQEFFRYERQLN